MTEDLTGKRVLVLGAETEIGRAATTAVAEAGASVAAVATTADAEAAFAVQRLARRLSSGERKVIAQAIDATNEAAVRVMVRQVSKELGGLDAAVYCGGSYTTAGPKSAEFIQEYGGKELRRGGQGKPIIFALRDWPSEKIDLSPSKFPVGWTPEIGLIVLATKDRNSQAVAEDVVAAIAGEADSG